MKVLDIRVLLQKTSEMWESMLGQFSEKKVSKP